MNGDVSRGEIESLLVVIREAHERLDVVEVEIAKVHAALESGTAAREDLLAVTTSTHAAVALLANDMAWVKSTFERESVRSRDSGGYTVTSRALVVVGIALVIVASVLGVRLPGWLGIGSQPSVTAPAPFHYPRPDQLYEWGPFVE